MLGWRGPSGGARLLAGSCNYEDGLPSGPAVRQFDLAGRSMDDTLPGDAASTGPLALGDVDGDGYLDLFVGGRVVPGRYPEAASSRLYRFDGKGFQLDATNSRALAEVGLVSAAVWSDLTGDGLPELVLACEWGPLKIFRNDHGRLAPWDPPVEFLESNGTHQASRVLLHELTGLWNGVTTGDLDGDGRLDIVAANWGLNSEYTASRERPLPMFHGDLLERGVVDVIETEWDSSSGAFAPRRRLDDLSRALPMLRERFRSHRVYSEATVTDALGAFAPRLRKLEITTLASMVFLNRGDHFESVPLPREAQLAPAFGVNIADFDGDGREDVFLSQNFFATAPETPRLDAGRGLVMRGDGAGRFSAMPATESGIEVYGEQRGAAVADFDADGRVDLVVAQNGAATKLFHNTGAKPGLRVRLTGPAGNRDGVGATVRLKFGSRFGPAREVHAGSGYWSQDGAIQVLSLPETPTHVWVRWPGGRTSTVAVPLGAKEVSLSSASSIRPE